MQILPFCDIIGKDSRMRTVRGLSFRRRKKKISLTSIQKAALWIGEVVLAFVIGCMLAWFFGFTLSNVGQSMEPAIYSGDRVLVNRLIYELKTPDYGDLIVFKPNGNQNAHYHIKRVAGKPGDTVTIESGRVFINGEVLDEKVQTESMADAGLAEEGITLGEDEFFVLGDNRNNSQDSRAANVGVIHKDDLLGRAWVRIWPLNKFGVIKHE